LSSPYPDSKKTEVVTTWLALGKVPMVEAVTGVPRATIRQWKLQPWWQEMVDTIQTESNQELDTKLSKIIERSLDAVNERIEGGEFILDSKTGTVKRVPVKLKDVHRVAVDLLDKRDLLRLKPAERQEQAAAVDILKKLAGQFADWAKVHIKEPRIVEGVVLHAIHEERKEGLQDGVQQISQPQEAAGEPVPTEPSTGVV
jgi:hypothetical protein